MLGQSGRVTGLLLSSCLFAACASQTLPSNPAVPDNATTIAPARAVAMSTAATYYKCPVFASGNTYNKSIATAPIDHNSSKYISSVTSAGDTGPFYASTGAEKANQATNSTPTLAVRQKVSYHTFPARYPWASSFFIEPLGDAHSMVVQTQTCHLYEAFSTSYSRGVLSAYSGANWDLTRPFVPLPKGQPSSMASGLSLFAGMVRWEDYQSGTIAHALDWCAMARTVAQYTFVTPASATDRLPYRGSSSYQLPYGARLRLHANFSTAGFGPEATMVVKAMKAYGIYLADTGTSGNGIYFGNAANGSNPWNKSDLRSLSKIHITDFDVIALPTIQSVR